jgi:cysteine desulfurase/selenocysteine lyase
MEHHSNIVPWQLVCGRKKAKVTMLPFDDNGRLMIEKLPEMISSKTKLIAVTMVSNALGVINPIGEIVSLAHGFGVPVLVDGAQAVQHLKIDVQHLDCDFLVFSGTNFMAQPG